jgi:hypothetical protein
MMIRPGLAETAFHISLETLNSVDALANVAVELRRCFMNLTHQKCRNVMRTSFAYGELLSGATK